MGIRRVDITCSGDKVATATAAFKLLQGSPACCDLTHGTMPSGEAAWVQFLSEDQDVPRTLAILAAQTGVGTEDSMRVAITEVLTAIPPLQQPHEEPEHTPWSKALAPRPRRTIHEIFMSIHSGCQLTFDYLAMVAAAAMISTIGLATDSAVAVVASMLLSPHRTPSSRRSRSGSAPAISVRFATTPSAPRS